MKVLKKLAIIVAVIPFLTGCWDSIEVNDVALVTAAGADQLKNGNIKLILQIAIPSQLGPTGMGGSGGVQGSTFVVSNSGKTVMEAYRRIQEKLPRRIFFSHSRIIVIGQSLARHGVSEVLDFFTRYPEARLNDYIIFTKGKAANLLETKTPLERVSSEEIRELNKEGLGIKVSLRDFIDRLLGEGIEPVAAQFKREPERSDGESASQSDQGMMDVAIVGAAVFRNDRLIGWLNNIETRGILWLGNNVKQGVIGVNIPKNKGGGRIGAQIYQSSTNIDPKIEGNNVKINVNIRSEMDVYENDSKLNLEDPKVIKYLQTNLENEIKARIKLTLNKIQKQYKSDIFGFGRAVYQSYPKVWEKSYKKQWTRIFPMADVKVIPHVKIKQTGLTNKSLSGKDG
ncbi:Ger(x)C family spore germination protein [Scopulibacillus cellulosilyticus]|uniref:Ger(X)C family spore germination protein n=1 Tax=Scopulibacillus cellulosilyticus TaxID=2665665 RepID=A0ABW2PU15_9BACL